MVEAMANDAENGDPEAEHTRPSRTLAFWRRRHRGKGGGGAGVREPRKPPPAGGSDAIELDANDGEVVSARPPKSRRSVQRRPSRR